MCSQSLPPSLPPMLGTGKSVTGAHIAYALAIKLRQSTVGGGARDVRTATTERVTIKKRAPCVMYCAPSNYAVNVVLGRSSEYTCIWKASQSENGKLLTWDIFCH